jgi:acetyl esterase/lipase
VTRARPSPGEPVSISPTGVQPPTHHPLRLRDRVERRISRLLFHLPPRVVVRLSGEPPVVVDGTTLDPHVQLVRAMRRRHNPHRYGLTEPTVEVARRRFRREALLFRGPATPVASVRDFEIPGDAGALRVRHYAPGAEEPRPLTVYLHGGGYVIGDLDTHDEACRILCRHANVHLLGVEYRLSPEHPFPAALDDTLAALRWARAHAAELGADAACVAIGGDSAGGNLAAVASQLAAQDEPPPAAQLLVYPVTDSETGYPSESLFGDGFFLGRGDRDAFAKHYLEGTGVTGDDPRVSPLLAADLSGLPPVLVVTAGFDILRDEGEAYAAALEAAGT